MKDIINNMNENVVYCYFVLANQICKIESRQNEFDFEIEKRVSRIVYRFIDKNLNTDQIKFLKVYYGIESGKALLDDDKVISVLKWSLKKIYRN